IGVSESMFVLASTWLRQTFLRIDSKFIISHYGVLDITAVIHFQIPVYMDRYGDCFHDGPIEVEESYTILSQGGEAYDTLTCQMTFKADKGSRLCLTFRSIRIDNCGVNLHVFSKESSNDKVLKRELSHEGYNFKLELRIYSEAPPLPEDPPAYADIPPPYTSLPQGGDDDPQSSQPSPETQHMLPHTEGKDVV
ncbi:hypothetical protein MAR_011478, partial [Mya arenaria]